MVWFIPMVNVIDVWVVFLLTNTYSKSLTLNRKKEEIRREITPADLPLLYPVDNHLL